MLSTFNTLGKKIARSAIRSNSKSMFRQMKMKGIGSMGNLGTSSLVVSKSNVRVPFFNFGKKRLF